MQSVLHRADATALGILRSRRDALAHKKSGLLSMVREQVISLWSQVPDSHSTIPLLVMLSFFFIGWRVSCAVSNCPSPLVVVLSGSMEPFMYRGDLLLLHNRGPATVGDVIVFELPNRTVPIVHRVHRVRLLEDGETRLFLTKGDNNELDDRTLYPQGYTWVKEKDIVGRVFLLVPRVGYLTLISEENPWVKFIVIPLVLIWGWVSGV
ncbi:putative Peptidase S24 like [Trypanosoma vivax]|uniref:Signal peptidase complex catalytic subunit SEC11 n=1 Tax=Trypanosoma vivax (strain Y486) TaxID=1055687 RepID=G0TVU5_TRYVY|nr:putative signal peptidase type I [Trypanosoma vivax]KAH8606826.1 putative Peptidase S24 like [Trypanosoma vivax]CCC48061.1 putative signal peptidase type I [Trypanosoma vivax Y486]